MPGVWLSVDHLCITWCKQLVLTVVRSLFDMVDSSTLQVSNNLQQRNDVLSYHFAKVLTLLTCCVCLWYLFIQINLINSI